MGYDIVDGATARNSPETAPAPLVLVVEPDDDTRALYLDVFRAAACEVMAASDGREALVAALTRPPAVVVTELRLPFVDGHALCNILRSDPATADLPIMVVAAHARSEEIERARHAGANVVLLKPAAPDEILKEVRRLLADGARPGPAAVPSQTASAPRHRDSQPRRLSRSFERFTTKTPATSPPELRCPSCDGALDYKGSYVGGVNARASEQWDHYLCPSCGAFEYRHRTRKLRPVD